MQPRSSRAGELVDRPEASAEANPAVMRWIDKRNSLRDKIYSLEYNRLWTPKDAGVATYQGRRKMDDGSEVL
ncbi:hypothetical protein RSW31_26065, partial [Escherichia coli]|uniref:hypothetical protein n=1 Tax=Escherichia coli TaxID=562 RepID=UPI0028DF6A18